jgi:hypothetical protein
MGFKSFLKKNPVYVKDIITKRKDVIVIFADTSGFSDFSRRTLDRPKLFRDFLLQLYNTSYQYSKKYKCYLKNQCDGVMFVYEFDARPSPDQAVSVLKSIENFQSDCESIIEKIPYPRPSGFRCRVTMGQAWKMMSIKPNKSLCLNTTCPSVREEDYWDYATILAARLLDIHKNIRLICCQAIKELIGMGKSIEFIRLPTEKWIPAGVFPQDIHDLWTYKSIRG